MSASTAVDDDAGSSLGFPESESCEPGLCRTQVIADTPAAQDLLGPHRRVADAIAAVVTGQKGGKAIALRGTWGSGKSTVVELLRNKLASPKDGGKAQVFVYDAWAHQGDPLRRSFLEQIVSFLHEKKWIDQERFRKQLDELHGRREHVTSRSTPLLTGYGSIVVASAFLVPFAIATFQITVSRESEWVNWPLQATLAVLLGALPLLLIAGKWVWERTQGRKDEDGLLGLLWNKTATVNRTTSLRTPEPTSVEFEDFFRSILTAGLTGDRKLVIVVDNLDRLDRSESSKIWATMRAFFDVDGKRAPWRDSLWLLVPFDATGISKLWKTGVQRTATAALPRARNGHRNQDDEADGGTEHASSPEGISDSFLQKTFQISFDLPEPVLSEWSEFFLIEMEFAFPEHSAPDREQIHLLYRQHADAQQSRITPRAIKLFLNRLVVLHIQWGHQIPFRTQAAWLLYKDTISPETLADARALDPDTQVLLEDQDWREHFAALHFNVEPEKAAQVLWEPVIRAALRSGDCRSLQTLQAVPVFTQICQRVLSREYRTWAQHEPNSIAQAITAVRHLRLDKGWYAVALWRSLLSGVLLVDRWRPFSESVAIGLVALLNRLENTDEYRATAKAIVNAVSNSSPEPLKGADKSVGPNITPGEWAKAAAILLQRVCGDSDVINDFCVPAPGEPLDAPEFYWGVLDAICLLAERQPEFEAAVPQFGPAMARTEIIGRLFKELNEPRIATRIASVNNMRRVKGGWPWEPIINALDQRLKQTNQPLGHSEALLELLLILEAERESRARESLQHLATSGVCAHYLNATRSLPAAMARHLFAILYYWNESAQRGANVQHAPAGWQIYDAFLRAPGDDVIRELRGIAERLRVYPEFIERLAAVSQRGNVATAMIRSGAEREDCEIILTPALVIKGAELIERALPGDKLYRVLARLTSKTNYLNELMEHKFDRSQGSLYLRVLETESGKASLEYHKFILDGLDQLNRAIWNSELNGNGSLLKLTFALDDLRTYRDFGQDLQDALLDQADRVLSGGGVLPPSVARWQDLLHFLSEQPRTVLLKDLRDRLLGAKGVVAPVLAMYGPVLARTAEIWEAKADDVVRRLFRAMLERKEKSELAWMLEVLRNSRGFSAACAKETRADILDRIGRIITDTNVEDTTRRMLEQSGKYFINV